MSWAPVLSLIGPTGPFGSTGPAGSVVMPKGLWVETDSYVVNDIAVSTVDNNAYICIFNDPTSATDPSANANWTLYLTSGPTGFQGDTGATGPSGQTVNEQGLWVAATPYVVDDVVLSTLDNNAYICFANVNDSADPSTNSTNWTLYLYGGPTGATGPTGADSSVTGPTGTAGSQIYGLGFSPQGNVDGVTGPVGATGPISATLLDYVFDLQNGLIWQPKRWELNPSDDFSVAGTTGDYVVNTQPAGVTGSSALLAPVSSVTYNVTAGDMGGNYLSGNTGFAIIGWNSVMASQGSTGTLYVNGSQAGLSGTTGPYLNDGIYGNTGSTVFDLTGTPWVPGSNVVVFEPSNPVSFVPDVFLTMEHTNFQMPPA